MKGFKQGAQVGEGIVSHGETMGFKHGGQVKKMGGGTMKTKVTGNPSDTGVQPAKPDGDNEMEKEAGGTGRLKPGYKRGGKVDGYRKVVKGGRTQYMKGGKAYAMKGGKMHAMKGGKVS